MSPLAALTAILMGSAVAITTGLLMVLAVYGILGSDYPRLMAEIPSLLRSLGLFGVLTAVSVAAFIGAVRYRSWRRYAQVGTYVWIAVIVLAYWPTRN